ncbi:MAG: hypothetical protein ACYDC3_10395 [Candidatus Binataceae bacterium]
MGVLTINLPSMNLYQIRVARIGDPISGPAGSTISIPTAPVNRIRIRTAASSIPDPMSLDKINALICQGKWQTIRVLDHLVWCAGSLGLALGNFRRKTREEPGFSGFFRDFGSLKNAGLTRTYVMLDPSDAVAGYE